MRLQTGIDKISDKRYTSLTQTLAIEMISELMGLSECRRVPTPIPEGTKPKRTIPTDTSVTHPGNTQALWEPFYTLRIRLALTSATLLTYLHDTCVILMKPNLIY